MAGIADEIKQSFRNGHWLSRLIYINLGVYILYLFIRMLSFLFQFPLDDLFIHWTALPSDVSLFLTRPWTLITYMFLHQGFFHILFNVLILYFTGQIFLNLLGDKRLFSVYMLGGLAGGILFVLAYNLLPAFNVLNPIMGASAGVMAVLFAAATKAPGFPVRLFFVLELKFWHVAALLVILDIAQMPAGNPGGHIAHLGGALVGFLYIQALNNGKDWSNYVWDFVRWISGIRRPGRPKMRTVHRTQGRSTTRKPRSGKKANFTDQERMDVILDKIREHGYEKLTREEKEFLFQFSRK